MTATDEIIKLLTDAYPKANRIVVNTRQVRWGTGKIGASCEAFVTFLHGDEHSSSSYETTAMTVERTDDDNTEDLLEMVKLVLKK